MNIPEYIINYHALFKNSNSENKEKFESKKRNIKADLYYLLYILLLLPEEKNKTCVPQKSKQWSRGYIIYIFINNIIYKVAIIIFIVIPIKGIQ